MYSAAANLYCLVRTTKLTFLCLNSQLFRINKLFIVYYPKLSLYSPRRATDNQNSYIYFSSQHGTYTSGYKYLFISISLPVSPVVAMSRSEPHGVPEPLSKYHWSTHVRQTQRMYKQTSYGHA